MRLIALVVCLGFSSLALAKPIRDEGKKPPEKTEKKANLLEQLQGVWQFTHAEHAGQAMPADKVANTAFVIEKNRILIRENGQDKEPTDFTLDATKKPAWINLTPGRPGGGEKTIHGIIEVKGDTLRICFEKGGQGERPTDFQSMPNTRATLIVMKKQAK